MNYYDDEEEFNYGVESGSRERSGNYHKNYYNDQSNQGTNEHYNSNNNNS